MNENIKKNMDLIIKRIKKGGIKIMNDYMVFERDNNDIYIAYYKPSIVDYNFNHKLIRHQYFKSENINNIEEIYMKLLRFGKTNYLDYVTYLKYYEKYVCDLCDIDKQGNRYKCVNCFEVDLCNDCYDKNKCCPSCNKNRIYKYSKNNVYPRVTKVTI